jgi:twitching motility two-component system response regulator PilH
MDSRKILIVDDSRTDLANLELILRREGCVVITATNGREALAKAHTELPDIIFMDIVMDDMDGFEAVRRLTRDSATKSIPVIFVSSKHQRADRVWALMQGAKDFITKPYEAADIIAQLRTHAGEASRLRNAPPASHTP